MAYSRVYIIIMEKSINTIDNISDALNTKNMVLFFTYGVSLEIWKKKGMLDRELKLYKKLGKKFNKIYFITYGAHDDTFQKDLEKYNIEVLYKKYKLPHFLYSLLIPWVYKKELKACHFFKTNQMLGSWTAVIAQKLLHKKLIVRTGYSLSIFSRRAHFFKYILSKIIEYVALKNADKFVVATHTEKIYYRTYSNKICVIPNYVDIHLFRPMPELKNKEAETVILFIGRLHPQKNLKNLLYALERIQNIRLQIIGSGYLKDELASLAQEKNIHVEFLGNKPHNDISTYINYADIFVLPSLYEGNPKLLLEAMACGVPIVTTRVLGITDVVTHEVNAYMSDITIDELSQSISHLIVDQNLQIKIGRNAREYVLKHNSFKQILKLELSNYN